MDVREKLVELLDDIQARGEDFTDYEIYGMRLPNTISNEDVASHLIANGVTVLPYKIGDEFWTEWVGIRKVRCSMITQKANGSWKFRFTVENSGGASIDIALGENERKLFLTKEEAELHFAKPPKGE